MSAIATAIVGSAVVGAVASGAAAKKGAQASKDASNAQLQAQSETNQMQWDMYEQNREDMQPWREAGVGALNQLTAGTVPGGQFNRSFTLGDFNADPGYAFRQQEGQKAIDNSAAARGSSLSGATLKALTRYGQDTASAEYGNAYNRWNIDVGQRFNRLSGLAGTGQSATQQIGTYGQSTSGNIAAGNMNTANNVASNTIQAGNARASGYVGMANAVTGGVGNYMSLSALGGSGGGGAGTSLGGNSAWYSGTAGMGS